MTHSLTGTGMAHGLKALAVSDGELNVISPGGRSSGGCSGSNSSLPSVPAEGGGGVGQVASWAVSFERLLEDPMGVHYFTAFLKSEVSVENILFWLACEKFRKIPADHTEQLCERALAIYEAFLSCTATHPVNIDDKGRVEEASLRTPHPGMFQQAQQQIFKLMKFDSYSRFVRSQLYQSCMLANVEGRSLPELSSRPKAPPAPPAPKVGPDAKERSKVRSGRPGGTELEEVERRKALLQGIIGWDKRKEKRGSWGESVGPGRAGGGRTAAEVDQVPQSDPGGSRAGRTRADKYCCVYLPDGTASLTPARPGVTVRSMLTGLCEKRGLPLSDIIIYLQGKDKQPLSMDQDSAVLKDQQVFLELRVTFAVEVAFTGRMVGMMVKSHKTLQDALATLLQKHRMRPQDAVVTMSGSGEALSMSTVATSLANKTLILNRLKDVEQAGGSRAAGPQGRRGAVDLDGWSTPQYRANVKLRNPGARRAYDMEAGLVELLNRAQGCSADDQRGLLRKEHLMLPQFLQHPPEGAVEEDEGGRERRERFADTRAEARSDMAAVDSGPASLLPPFLPLEGAERSGSTAGDPGRETAV